MRIGTRGVRWILLGLASCGSSNISKVSGFLHHPAYSTRSLRDVHVSTRRIPSLHPTRRSPTTTTTSKTGLYSIDNNSTETPLEVNFELLAVDLFGIILGSQLVGLVDVLNDPDFWAQGGFNQPIPAVPATLGTLVQRTSIIMISWILGNPTMTTIEGFWRNNDDATTTPSDKSVLPGSNSGAFKASIGFVLVRFSIAATLFLTAGINVDALDILRQCYFTIILIVGLRYVYSAYIS